MSDRTQEEGRSYYTEHNFAYTPSNFAKSDRHRENQEWQIKLLWETRRFDPTFDVEGRTGGRKKPLDVPHVVFDESGQPFNVVWGKPNQPWEIRGQITNFDPKAAYSDFVASTRNWSFPITVNNDGSFKLEGTTSDLEIQDSQIVFDVSFKVSRDGMTQVYRGGAWVKYSVLVPPPIISNVAFDTADTVEDGETVNFTAKVSLRDERLWYAECFLTYENEAGIVEDIIDTYQWTDRPTQSISIPLDLKKLRLNANEISLRLKSAYPPFISKQVTSQPISLHVTPTVVEPPMIFRIPGGVVDAGTPALMFVKAEFYGGSTENAMRLVYNGEDIPLIGTPGYGDYTCEIPTTGLASGEYKVMVYATARKYNSISEEVSQEISFIVK